MKSFKSRNQNVQCFMSLSWIQSLYFICLKLHFSKNIISIQNVKLKNIGGFGFTKKFIVLVYCPGTQKFRRDIIW